MDTRTPFPINSDYTTQVRIIALHYAVRVTADFEQPRNGSHYRPGSTCESKEVISLAKDFEKYINGTK